MDLESLCDRINYYFNSENTILIDGPYRLNCYVCRIPKYMELLMNGTMNHSSLQYFLREILIVKFPELSDIFINFVISHQSYYKDITVDIIPTKEIYQINKIRNDIYIKILD